jgi:hypothetical protein
MLQGAIQAMQFGVVRYMNIRNQEEGAPDLKNTQVPMQVCANGAQTVRYTAMQHGGDTIRP